MNLAATPRLDIVIPVYNEGANILPTLQSLQRAVKTPFRVLICYDRDDDNTLTAIRENGEQLGGMPIAFVRNNGRGALGAVLTGLAASDAPFTLVMMAGRPLQCRYHRCDGGEGANRLRHRLCQSVHARWQHGWLSLAQGSAGAGRQFHAISARPIADA